MKSSYDPAELANKSGTATYTFSGNGVTAVIDQVNAKGQKVHIECTATLDEQTEGQVLTTNHIVVAPDGKSRTVADGYGCRNERPGAEGTQRCGVRQAIGVRRR